MAPHLAPIMRGAGQLSACSQVLPRSLDLETTSAAFIGIFRADDI